MRTKTLLIAAAAMAVGIISSQAQVYSQNIVGYYNVTVPAGQYYILGNQLVNGSDALATNNDINTVFSSGFTSDPNGPGVGSQCAQLMIWNGALNGYVTYYYLNAADAVTYNGAGSTAGWVDSGGNPVSGVSMPQGSAAFVLNPTAGSMTPTILGSVVQGTNTLVPIAANQYSLVSLAQPISTNLDLSGIGISGLSSDPNGPGVGSQCAQMLVWNGALNGYVTYYYLNAADAVTYNGAGSMAGLVDSGGNPQQVNLNVGQGVFLYQYAHSINYTNVFNPK
jgi:hypothetical protein